MQDIINYVSSHLTLIGGAAYLLIDEIFAFKSSLKSNSILNFIYNQLKSLLGKT